MIIEASREAARATQPAFSNDDKALTEAAYQSLRDFRLARVANRRFPSQSVIRAS